MIVNHSRKTVNMWWPTRPKPGNVGDILSPWLIKKITGYKPVFVLSDDLEPKLTVIGSIVAQARDNTTVWGSGLIKKDLQPSRKTTYLAVRGPLTRKVLQMHELEVPEVYGDPALLLPHLHKRPVEKKYRLGIFPHYVDYEQAQEWYAADKSIKIINALNADPIAVVDEIRECETIVSSSLHGIIIAQAYGIPCHWVKFSDKLFGDDIKFHDYFQSVNVDMGFTRVDEKLSYDELIGLKKTGNIEFDHVPLMDAFNKWFKEQ